MSCRVYSRNAKIPQSIDGWHDQAQRELLGPVGNLYVSVIQKSRSQIRPGEAAGLSAALHFVNMSQTRARNQRLRLGLETVLNFETMYSI
jgi:hypothetical protein